MHALQPKHTLLKEKEAEELLKIFNLSRQQLPKIKISDAAIPQGSQIGDMVKVERHFGKEKKDFYRLVVE